MVSQKHGPIWIYDCVVSQSVNDFILYVVDLTQPCKKFASGLSESSKKFHGRVGQSI